jgi:hypothetical protein
VEQGQVYSEVRMIDDDFEKWWEKLQIEIQNPDGEWVEVTDDANSVNVSPELLLDDISFQNITKQLRDQYGEAFDKWMTESMDVHYSEEVEPIGIFNPEDFPPPAAVFDHDDLVCSIGLN